jgi:hypothetical protein
MSLAVEWTYSAEAALKRIHWRKASDVAGAVYRFAEAPRLLSVTGATASVAPGMRSSCG